jgi:hypothetical protein
MDANFGHELVVDGNSTYALTDLFPVKSRLVLLSRKQKSRKKSQILMWRHCLTTEVCKAVRWEAVNMKILFRNFRDFK